MYAKRTAAEMLGVTPNALDAALRRGETIATLTRACGLDLDVMTTAIIDAEMPDIDALATVAGFTPEEIAGFESEIRAYLIAFVHQGERAADAMFDRSTLAAA